MAPDGAHAGSPQRSLSRDALRANLKSYHRYVAGKPGGWRADLRGAILARATLSGSDLRESNLTRARLPAG